MGSGFKRLEFPLFSGGFLMDTEKTIASTEEFLARILPPQGYEGCVVIALQGYLVWKHRRDVTPGDAVCFFDGDCRTVLTPNDPRVRHLLG